MSDEPAQGPVAANAARRKVAPPVDLRDFGLLTGPQCAMLARLDDGPDDDSVGLEAEALSPHQIAVCERLVGKDLVRFDVGWRYSCWFRLTPAGRDALRQLRTARRADHPAPSRKRAGSRKKLYRTIGAGRRNPARSGPHLNS